MRRIAFVFLLCVGVIACGVNPEKERALQKKLAYLNDISEVAWVDFAGNDVYVGFSKIPDDLKLILQAAALNGNNEIDFGVHIWAVDATKYKKGWRPGSGSYIAQVSARHGKIES